MSTPTATAAAAEVKLCECGCGEPTPPAKRTDARHGLLRGRPLRYLPSHAIRHATEIATGQRPELDQRRRAAAAQTPTPAVEEARLCECGCGEPTQIATKTYRREGRVKGKAARFIKGHNARMQGSDSPPPRLPRPPRASKPPRRQPSPDGTATGHPVGDLMLPAAMQLVGAVRRGDQRAAHEAVAEARRVSYGHQYWVFAFLCTVAAMVPEDQTTSELLAWIDTPPEYSTAMRVPA